MSAAACPPGDNPLLTLNNPSESLDVNTGYRKQRRPIPDWHVRKGASFFLSFHTCFMRCAVMYFFSSFDEVPFKFETGPPFQAIFPEKVITLL
jgi:hypothetical protein